MSMAKAKVKPTSKLSRLTNKSACEPSGNLSLAGISAAISVNRVSDSEMAADQFWLVRQSVYGRICPSWVLEAQAMGATTKPLKRRNNVVIAAVSSRDRYKVEPK